jgi:ATPase subunit of ABC transporter with duplicated ATPase domains
MTLINIRNLGVTLGAPLFSGLNLVVNAGDRIALVAANGRGKSTLLRCIAGTMEATEGEITRSRGLTVGHVEQDVPEALMDRPFDVAVLEALSADQRRSESWRVDVALESLEVPEALRQRPLKQLSGGWQRLAMLARVLVTEADVLLLDEPTNHLDLDRIARLENWLNALPREMPVVISSHDRAFLDATTRRTLFLRPEQSQVFSLPYTRARAALREADAADERRHQRDLKTAQQLRQQAARLNNIGINSGSDLLLSKTRQLKQRAGKLEDAARPAHLERSAGTIRLSNRGTHAKVLVTLDDATVETPDGRLLFRTGKQFIRKGDRIVLLGPNGAGKTRLVAMLRAAIEDPDAAQDGIKATQRSCSAIAIRRSPVLPTPTRRCARSFATMSAISVRARCSRAPASRSRCRAVRSAGFPAGRKRVSACWCCGSPSPTSICSMSRPTTWTSRDRKHWRTS